MLRFIRTKGKHTATIWWVLIVIVVVTFLGGFVFLLGSGLDSSYQAKVSGAVGTVDGKPITRTEYQSAIDDQREGYRRQYGSDPPERDLKMLEIQAWRNLIMQRVMDRKAQALGLKAYDHDVIVTLKTNPPPMVLSSPSFQTDGKFDIAKYQAAITDPNNEAQVAALEAMTRRQIPLRKLQERLLSSIKLPVPELREAFRNRFETVSAWVVQVPPDASANVPAPTDADLDRVYQKYRDRFTSPARTQVEALVLPKNLGEEELRGAREQAQALVNRARGGEDFATLARDYSEGPNADKGGMLDRPFHPSELGPELGARLSLLPVGGISDPIQDRSRFLIFKVIERTTGPDGQPSMSLAQIMVRARPSESALNEQYQTLLKLRGQATKIGLGKAAAAKAMATSMTTLFAGAGIPPELFEVPEAADWGLGAKAGEVSPVFQGSDAFAVVQVISQHPAGQAKRDEVTSELRRIAELDARVERSKAKADAVARALSEGRTLEQAAESQGAIAFHVDGMSRLQADQRLASVPEVVGAIFASRPDQVFGPMRQVDGWYFARLESRAAPDTTLLTQIKTQLTNDLLQRRQESFLSGYATGLRAKASVKDLRNETVEAV